MLIRKSVEADFAAILAIVNDAAHAYRGVIPADRWHDPYMALDELVKEIAAGVVFWVAEERGRLLGVMAIQDKGDVALVRHAYVAPATQRTGVGTTLLHHVKGLADKPILIGTWAAATWAIEFYQRNGFTVVASSDKDRLLRTYWSIPARQIETSVVLADGRWMEAQHRAMEHHLQNTAALLTRTPAALDALLRDLPDMWTSRSEGEETWSVFDIVGHLIHGERTDWIPRVRMVLQFGDTRTFETFDRLGHVQESQGKTLGLLLDEFARLRSENLSQLRALNLQPEDLERRGRHPRFGVVTLSELLATWAAHDLTHLHQISRVMAHQYRDAVGPWTEFLGVLQCAGHSSP